MKKISSALIVWVLIVSGMVLALPEADVEAQSDGLVAHWDFNEGTGTTVSDSSGNGNDGTINGASWTTGKVGSALSFDGVDDYVEIADSDSFDISTQNTFEVWVNLNSNQGGVILSKWVNAYEDKTLHIADNLAIHYALFRGWGTEGIENVAISNTMLTSGAWFHIVGTYNGEYQKIYINGMLDSSKSVTGEVWDSDGTFYIGRAFRAENLPPFNGLIDQVRIYNRALSASEILANYNAIGGNGAVEVHIKPLYPLTDPEDRKIYRGVELNACFQTTDAGGNALNGVSVNFDRSDELGTPEQFTSQNQVYSNYIADDGVIKIDWAISLTYSEATFTLYIESDAQYNGESVTLVFDDLAEYTYEIQNEIKTNWDKNRDTYSFGNFKTDTNTGGCCYGLSCTALLYFYHYQLCKNQYPYFPLQSYSASTTRDLNIAFDWDNYFHDNQNIIDNVVLAIIAHQQYDKGRGVAFSTDSNIRSECRTQEFKKLCQNLSDGYPVILGVGKVVGTSVINAHSVIAWSLYYTSNDNVIINVSDPNAPNEIWQAYYNIETTVFEYGSRPDFMLQPCELLTKASLTIPDCNVFTELLPPGYWIVIADKMVHIHNINEPNQIDKFTEAGNSQSFIMGIPNSAGITEGEIQVYAIPQSISPQIDDPSTTPSSLMVTRVTNESGNRAGYGFSLNISSDTQYDYELTPSDNGFNITPKNSTVNLNVTLFSADSDGYYVFKSTNISIPPNTRAEILVKDWKGLNSTTISSVTLNLYDEGSSSPKETYELTNGQAFVQNSAQSGDGEIITVVTVLIIAVVTAVIIAAVAILAYFRRRTRSAKADAAEERQEKPED